PELKDIQKVSRAIAFAVGKMAQQQGVAVKTSAEALQQAIDDNFWQAEYRDYRRSGPAANTEQAFHLPTS
ncbi:hypothetical protein ACUOA8_62950, partial [Escherichia sp. SS-MK2]